MSDAGKSLLDALKKNKGHQNNLASAIEGISDPYKTVGAKSKEDFFKLSDEDRVVYDKRLITLIKVNTAQANSYKLFSDSISSQSKTLVDMMKVISELNKSGQMIDSMLKRKVRDELKEMGLKLQEKKSEKLRNPLDPVSDEDRFN